MARQRVCSVEELPGVPLRGAGRRPERGGTAHCVRLSAVPGDAVVSSSAERALS